MGPSNEHINKIFTQLVEQFSSHALSNIHFYLYRYIKQMLKHIYFSFLNKNQEIYFVY